jgi:long-chain acyl-CoA synthetase
MSDRPWLKSYPKAVPHDVDPDQFRSLVEVFHRACDRFKDKPCFTSMGVTLSYGDIDRLSGEFATFLRRDLGLVKGDRIGLQMPNILQYPVALFGALRAGLVVVNTNPLYTPREMEHQYADAGVKAIVILANFAHNLQKIFPSLSRSTELRAVVTEVGDLFPTPKRIALNAAAKYLKKMVPDYDLPHSISFRDALARGRRHRCEDVALTGDDLAFLQYTGGTTGVAKGAMLTHRNVVANVEQANAWMSFRLQEGEEVIVTPLPLYHIFSLTVNCLLFMRAGGHNILVANPRDLAGFVKLLRGERFTILTAVNTLLTGLMNRPDFASVDFSRVKITVAGATALQGPVAERWRKLTKTSVIEGYGLTEASPIATCNPIDGTDRIGTIGLPFPSTDVRLCDENGSDVAPGQPGELCVRGPQVMKGYWNLPEETATTLRNGWLCTGDVAEMDQDGFFRIVDRKKDMILVSGFNVYPNEVEAVIAAHPGVAEVGAIGIPDDKTGEAVKIVVVKRNASLTAEELIAFARNSLAGYKVPKHVEFRDELPKTPVGKVLRRLLK